jgi:hypothetical protein
MFRGGESKAKTIGPIYPVQIVSCGSNSPDRDLVLFFEDNIEL